MSLFLKPCKSLLLLTFITALIVLCLFNTSNARAAQEALRVDDIRFGDHGEKLRIVADLNGVTNFRAFALSNPSRIVIDLPQFAPSFEKRNGGISGGKQDLIKEYRYGILQNGVSRLVFETHKPAIVRDIFYLAPAKGQSLSRLVIDIQDVDIKTFQREINNIKGVKSLQDLKILTQTAAPKLINPEPEIDTQPKAKPKQSFKKRLIVIDAGHGGKDPGAVSASKVLEKDITLGIAKVLKQELERTGRYEAMLTRDGDYYIKLRQRVYMARDAEADLFISIHADSLQRNNVRGASIYTLSENASDKETARLAERENRSDIIAGVPLEQEVDEVADILIDLAMRDTMNQSKLFANTLVDSMGGSGIKLLPNTHRHAGFAVLKAPDIPSVLVETGYLSNRTDATLLTKPNHQRKIARSIVGAIDQFFKNK